MMLYVIVFVSRVHHNDIVTHVAVGGGRSQSFPGSVSTVSTV